MRASKTRLYLALLLLYIVNKPDSLELWRDEFDGAGTKDVDLDLLRLV